LASACHCANLINVVYEPAMTMNYTVLVYGAPHVSQAPSSALSFAHALLAAGHQLRRVFFYADGVSAASAFAVAPADEQDVVQAWAMFAAQHEIELAVCIAASLKRGVLNADEAQRYERTGSNVHPGFLVTGLGQLIDGLLDADRVVSFHP
jgi:tRNA 2-thiouridine synthesizing protein D